MKSIKPGRGPSMMSGFMCIVVGVFGVIWTIAAAGMGGGLFALFGIIFVIVAIVMAVYNFKNATGKNRYSAFDITEGKEEPDPLNELFSNNDDKTKNEEITGDSAFCPYCGTKVNNNYEYCNKCGKKLP